VLFRSICHSEGAKLGIASNHGDVMHWFPKFGKNMDTFRAEVKAGLAAAAPVEPVTPKKYYRVQLGAYSVKANADAMLKKVKAAGFSDAFVKYSE
jgi:N-acetylmuramoyl-L-alanine amidase